MDDNELIPKITELAQKPTRWTRELVTELAQSLGWSVRETSGQQDGASYSHLLISGSKECIAVFTTPWGAPLELSASSAAGMAPFAAITDGKRWAVYENHCLAVADSPVLEFDLFDPPGQVAEAVRALGPAALMQAIPPCNLSIRDVGLCVLVEGREFLALRQPRSLVVAEAGNGPLTMWRQIPAYTWAALMTELVRWLVAQGKLRAEHCPVRRPMRPRRHDKYILHTEPKHPTGTPFRESQRRRFDTSDGQIWLDTQYNLDDHLENIETLLTHVGENPRAFGITW